ncbi:MAG: vWA domain-containing protein [Dehalococcoidia bacterium]
MTLALYGKSKRRKGGLLFTGFMAIMVAMLVALATMGSDSALAASAGPNSPGGNGGTGSGTCGSDVPNAQVVGGSYTACSDGQTATYTTFGFAIPAGSTINGIEVTYITSTSNNDNSDGWTVDVSNGTFGGNKSNGTNTEGTPPSDTESVGASNDLWGKTWTVAQANAIQVRFTADSGNDTMYLDDVRVEITYSAADADGDGVPDANDTCPGTLAGAPGVNASGCDYYQQLLPSVVTNPPRPDTCSIDFSLVLDRSGSFTSGQLTSEETAAKNFIDAVFGQPFVTPTFRVVGFADDAITPSVGGIGPHVSAAAAKDAVDSVADGTYTNWGAGLTSGYAAGVDWMIVITDGNPNRPGSGSDVSLGALQSAVTAANTAKGGGAHITVVGVDTSGNAPAGFGPISQSYAALVGAPDVITLANIGSLDSTLQDIAASCAPPPARTVRVVKVTDNQTHPGGAFGGAITPGGADAANQAWSQTLAANGGNTNPGETNTVSTAAHTVSETTLPANWANAGYYVAIDTQQSCSGTEGYSNAGGTASIPANSSNYLVCVKNTYTPPLVPSVSVTKTHSGDGIYDLGESFYWTITWTVTNPETTSSIDYVDNLLFAFQLDSISDEVDPDGKLSCTTGATSVSCTLDAGAGVGAGPTVYSIRVNNTVKTTVTNCGEYSNDVRKTATPGIAEAFDIVDITGCGSVTFDKKNGVIDGQNIKWDIEITNSSVVAGNITIYDPSTSLGSETCTNAVSESPADTYYCELAGNSTAHLYLLTSLPSDYNAVCDSIQVNNIASIAGNYQSSDLAEYIDTVDPDGSCFAITKKPSDLAQTTSYMYWDISVTNNTDATQAVFIVDSGAFYVGASDGSCDAVSDAAMSNGIVCSVARDETLVVHVGKVKNLNVCEGSDTNSATVYLGRNDDGPVIGTPTSDPINYRNEGQCTTTIRICKVWAFNAVGELSDGTTSFVFDVSDTSESEEVTITGVTEGEEEPVCVLVDVDNGLVRITEQVPAGFVTPVVETDNITLWSEQVNGIQFTTSSCHQIEEIDQDPAVSVDNLVRQVFNVVTPSQNKEYSCTITFINADNSNRLPSGDLRVEKYLDINGDGDANDAGEGLMEWDVTVAGAPIAGSYTLIGGVRTFSGLEYNDVYTVTEDSAAGYTVTNATVDGVSKGAVTSTNATIPNGGTTVIRFYNQPLGGITVHKDTYNVVNNIESQNFNDDDGWKITVDSATCNIHQSKNTDSNGNATFSGLPLCTDYVVKEDLNNPGAPGYSPVTPATVTGVTPTINGNTQVNFVNQTKSTDPICTIGCTPRTTTPTTPTTPPSTPTTPPTTTVTPPTNTPTTPASPSETAIAGEKTPGPGNPTPIAPSTGSGLMGGTAAGMNLLLLLGGILALASGLSFVALGRKSRS